MSPSTKRQKCSPATPAPFAYATVDPERVPDPAAFLPRQNDDADLDARYQLDLHAHNAQPGTPATPGGGVLRQYKALCELLLPGLRTHSHLSHLINRCPTSVSLVLREHGVVIGGSTFRIIRSSNPPLLILDTLLLAVDQRPGVCGHGYGTRLVNYAKALLLQLAARANAGAVMITQADAGGGVANRFWARQRLRFTPQALHLLRALHAWDPANELYAHAVPMMCWLQPGAPAAACAAGASVRAQKSATVEHLLNFRHTRHTPEVRVRLRGAWTLLPPLEVAPEEEVAPMLGLAEQPAGRCTKCHRASGTLLECRACCRPFHAGCAAAPRSAEGRGAAKLYAAAAHALEALYPLAPALPGAPQPEAVTCGDCCALVASGGAEDGSGCFALGRGVRRLSCEAAVSELCEQSEAWREARQSEGGPAAPDPQSPLSTARSSPRLRETGGK